MILDHLPSFRPSPLSLGALAFGSAGVVVAYVAKRYLDQTCPRIHMSRAPHMSACRQLVQRACTSIADVSVPKPWGASKSGLVPSWAQGSSPSDRNCWLPSHVAIQIDVPLELLANYKSGMDDAAATDSGHHDIDKLARNLFVAFLDARSRGPDGWLIDRDVPPLSWTPGSHLFGDSSGISAFLFGCWSSKSAKWVQPSFLPPGAPIPSASIPSNEALVTSHPHRISEDESAGTVLYWKSSSTLVDLFNSAASYGLPWRFMDGGFQELVVEHVSDETARLTYISVECSDMHPGGQEARDFKRMPRLIYELHVIYAQSLLLGAVRQLVRATGSPVSHA